MKILDKKLVDETIRLGIKYYSATARGSLNEYIDKQLELRSISGYEIAEVISNLAAYKHRSDCTCQQIYDCLKVLGYEVK